MPAPGTLSPGRRGPFRRFTAGLAVAVLAAASLTPASAQQPSSIGGERVPTLTAGWISAAAFSNGATGEMASTMEGAAPQARRRAPRPVAPGAPAGEEPLESALALSTGVRVATGFKAAALGDLGSLPPDPAVAAGPTQIIVAANGRLRSYARATAAPDGVLDTTTNAFFASVRGAGTPSTPRVRYDRLTGRWFVLMATDALPGRLVLATSSGPILVPGSAWTFFSFDNTFTGTGCAFDSPTLGVDASALYVGVNQFCANGTAYAGTSAYVIRKSSVLSPGTAAVTAFHNLTGSTTGAGPFAPVGVDNDDPTATTGYFIGVDNGSLGTLVVRRVSTPGGTPTLSANLSVSVAATAAPIPVRHLGNLNGADGLLDAGDDRLTTAVIQGGRLWTAQSIGVDHTGAASGSATRNGVRWYEIGSLTGTPALVQSGTVFTAGSSGSFETRNYWLPSIATTARGRTILAFDTAGSSEAINAGAAERVTTDPSGVIGSPALLTSAAGAYNPPVDPGGTYGRRWGGHSDAVMDACDGASVWTVAPYADATNSYGLQVSRVVGPPPATPVSVSPSTIASGTPSIDVQITGSSSGSAGFFDNAAFFCRAAASIPGVTVNRVTVTSATTATLNLSTVGAVPGTKAITVVNPDGQAATSAPLLMVMPGALAAIDLPGAGRAGQPLVVRGWAVDGRAASGSGVDAVHVYAYSPAGTPTFLGASTYGLERPDIAASYGSRFRTSGFTLTAPAVLPQGAYTIVAYAHSTATGTFDATASVAVTLTAPAPPFGVVDTPTDGATVAGEVAFTGWALDDAGIAGINLYRSPVAGEGTGLVYLGRATVIRGARPDVQGAYPGVPDSDAAGWGFMVLTNMLPNQGNGTFDIHAYAVDISGLSTRLGSRRIVAANASATVPFGTIDTPGQGETVSGTVVNFGWALVAQPRIIPLDGSTIDVYVDGVLVGHPVYDNYRADLAGLFPGLRNSNGAVGYFLLDTTQLTNGLHTIAWVARDDAGRSAGLGSRFFRVQNGS